MRQASLIGGNNKHMTHTQPIRAAQTPGSNWLSNGHMTQAKPMRIGLGTFAAILWKRNSFLLGSLASWTPGTLFSTAGGHDGETFGQLPSRSPIPHISVERAYNSSSFTFLSSEGM